MTSARVHVKRARNLPALPPNRALNALLTGACLALMDASSPATAKPLAVLAVPRIPDLAEIVFLKPAWRM